MRAIVRIKLLFFIYLLHRSVNGFYCDGLAQNTWTRVVNKSALSETHHKSFADRKLLRMAFTQRFKITLTIDMRKRTRMEWFTAIRNFCGCCCLLLCFYLRFPYPCVHNQNDGLCSKLGQNRELPVKGPLSIVPGCLSVKLERVTWSQLRLAKVTIANWLASWQNPLLIGMWPPCVRPISSGHDGQDAYYHLSSSFLCAVHRVPIWAFYHC